MRSGSRMLSRAVSRFSFQERHSPLHFCPQTVSLISTESPLVWAYCTIVILSTLLDLSIFFVVVLVDLRHSDQSGGESDSKLPERNSSSWE